MATTTKANLNDVLKHVHGPRMVKIFNDNNLFYNRLKKRRKVKFSGRDFLYPVHIRRQGGVGFYSGSDNLPAADHQTVDEASVTVKQLAARIALTGLAIESGKTDKDGFARLLTFETKGAARDLADEAAMAVYGMPDTSNYNGVLCEVSAVGVLSPVVKNPLGYISGTDVPSVGGARYIRVGMKLAWGAAAALAGGTAAGFGEVTEVNYATETITLDSNGGGANPAANDLFVRGWSLTNFSYKKSFNGLGTLVSPGATFQGITVDTSDPTGWNPFSQTAAGAFDQTELHDLVQNIGVVGAGETSLMVADPTMSREYIDDVVGDVRLQPQKLKGGYTLLQFASGKVIDWVFDKYAPYGVIHFIDEATLFWLMQRDFGWDTTDGNVLKYIADKDQFSGFYKAYCALGFDSLNSNGVLKNISISGNPL